MPKTDTQRVLCYTILSRQRLFLHPEHWLYRHIYMCVFETSRLTTLQIQLPSLGTKTWSLFLWFENWHHCDLHYESSNIKVCCSLQAGLTAWVEWLHVDLGGAAGVCVSLVLKFIFSRLWGKKILDIAKYMWILATVDFRSTLHFSRLFYELWGLVEHFF